MILNVRRLFVFGLLLVSSQVLAQGDAESGAIIGETCLGCHGIGSYTNVYPTYKVPKLGGQHGQYIAAALKAYRDGSRAHPTMEAQAARLSDEEIADISAYLAGLEQ
ncbi:MAG: cytochrome c [Pseudomonadota bacterium]